MFSVPRCVPLLLALALSFGSARAQQRLQNAGFEAVGTTLDNATPGANGFTGSGQLARDWDDNSSWADVGVVYALDKTNPHGGQTSQRVEVTRVNSGAAQFVQSVKFQKGHIYRFSAWLRGNAGAQLTLQYQQTGAPYANYGNTVAFLTPEWRKFSVLGRAIEDTNVFLMLRASAPVTYWIDDANFDDITGATSNQKPQTGNLLPDGSFESGIGGGWNARVEGDPDVVWRDLNLQSVAGQTPVGQRFAQLHIAPHTSGTITGPVMNLRFGVPHTFSAWLRGSAPNTRVALELDGTDLRLDSTIGTTWTRVSWTFTPPPQDYARLRIVFPDSEMGERTVALDGAMLEEGDVASPIYRGAAPHEMTLRAPRTGNIFFPGERGVLSVQIAPAPPPNASLMLAVTDSSGAEQTLPPQRAGATLALPFGAAKQGLWKLRATLQNAAGAPLSTPTELVWARLPRPATLPAGVKSYFGLHIPFAPVYIGVARDLGQRFVRLHDASMIGKWPIAEPQPGHFEFYDKQVNAAHAAGLSILGMLDGAPPRVSTQPRPGGYWGIWNIPDQPDALAQWRTYVSTVAAHYRGRIDDWEVWNEPWGQWWLTSGNPNATPALYAQFLRAADEAAHRANPAVTVLGIDTFIGHDDAWTQPVLAQSGTATFDVFSFHDYNAALVTGRNRIAAAADHFRELQRAVGPVKPLWNTEGGPGEIGSFYAPQTGGLPFNVQPAYIVRYDVSSLAAGVRHFFVYAAPSGTPMGNAGYNALEHDFAPRPILAARAVLASLVDGRAMPTRKTLAPGLTCYAFAPGKKGEREIDVIWRDDAPQKWAVPRGFEALDIWGNALAAREIEIGAEPIYLRAR